MLYTLTTYKVVAEWDGYGDAPFARPWKSELVEYTEARALDRALILIRIAADNGRCPSAQPDRLTITAEETPTP